jgi:hypothetical protein
MGHLLDASSLVDVTNDESIEKSRGRLSFEVFETVERFCKRVVIQRNIASSLMHEGPPRNNTAYSS